MRSNYLGMGATQQEIDELLGFEAEYEVVARPDGRLRVYDLVNTFQMKSEAIEHADLFYAEHPECAVFVQYENRFGTYNRIYEAQK